MKQGNFYLSVVWIFIFSHFYSGTWSKEISWYLKKGHGRVLLMKHVMWQNISETITQQINSKENHEKWNDLWLKEVLCDITHCAILAASCTFCKGSTLRFWQRSLNSTTLLCFCETLHAKLNQPAETCWQPSSASTARSRKIKVRKLLICL